MTSDEKENFFDPNPGMVRVNSRKGVKISEYDNAVTALYKLSDSLLIPIEYIYLEGNNFKNYTYTTVNKIIADRIGEDIELKDFYQEISDKLPKLKWWELGLLYYEVVTVKLKQLCENTGNEEMIERCTNLGTKKNLIKSINQMFAAVREAGKSEDEELIDITNLDAFASEYKKWSKTRKMKMKEQSEISEKISSVQEELDSIRGVRYYKPNIDTVTYKLKPMISGKEGPYRPSPEEGIEIFKNAIVSEDVPYIQYNPEDGRNLFWIFNNNNKAVSPVSYLDHISQSTRINTIYILLWLSDAKQKNNLVKCIYYVDTGEFTLKAPNKGGGLKKLRKNIEAAFPMLILGKEKQIRVQGYFEVDDVTINEISYHYMLNTDDLHKMYLYIEESGKAFADRHRSNIHYRSVWKIDEETNITSSVTISFGSFIAENDDEGFIPESVGPNVSPNTEVSGKIRINVVKAESIEVLEQFQIVFSRLLARYKASKKDIEEYINFIIPEYFMGTLKSIDSDEDEDSKKKNKSVAGGVESKNNNLRRKEPGLFVAKYARACQCNKQPLLIKADEVEDWRNYSKDGNKRQVMPYPPLKPDAKNQVPDPLTMKPDDNRVKLWVVCPGNKLPYPALKRSKLTNRDEYPYIPCCGYQDNLSYPKSNYYNYYSNDAVTSSAKKNKYAMHTMKILRSSGRKGGVGKMLPRLLSSYQGVNETEKIFKRYGVPVGNNSLIHCVLIATGETNYSKLRSDSEKEKYAFGVREYMAKTMNTSLFKQELYDMSKEEIISQLESHKVDFASEKFYRGLEEIFNVNIFVFDSGSSPEHPAETEEKLTIEIPRSKICHIRPNKDTKNSVLVFKHWGTEIDKIANPHCELIISSTKAGETSEEENKKSKRKNNVEEEIITYIFDEDMTKILYETLHRSMKIYVWSYPEDSRDKVTSEDLITRINPFSQVDWKSLFSKYNIVSQRVDSYGKLRVIGVQIKKDTILPLFIPPSQPFNLPNLIKIQPVSEDLVLSILGTPSGIAVAGLWYSVVDYAYGIYVPTIHGENITFPNNKEKKGYFERVKLPGQGKQKREVTEGLPHSPVIINIEEEYPIEKMRIAKRNIYFMVQILSWLWLVDERSDNVDDGESLKEWWQEWVIDDDAKINPEIENVEGLGIKLPDISNTAEGIKIMSKLWPNFFKDKKSGPKIHFYPALGEKLRLFFERKEKTSDINRKNRIKNSKILRGIYIWETDFVPAEAKENRTLIFLSASRLQIWIENQMKKTTNTGTQISIFKQADPSRVFGNKPYIYMDTITKKTYIIQNVQGGDLERVLNLCKEWRATAKNIGFSAPPINIEGIPYVLYSISPERKFVQIEDKSNKDRNYHHVIKYTKEGRYAAMLPLL